MNFRVITKQDLLSGGRDVEVECFRGEMQAKVLHRDIFFIAIFAALVSTSVRSLICNMSFILPISHNLSLQDALFVFALQAEAAEEFADCNTLITGIGKVSAT